MAKMAPEEVDTSLPMEDGGIKMKKRKVMMPKKPEVKRDDLVGFTSSESSSSEDEEEDENAVSSQKPPLIEDVETDSASFSTQDLVEQNRRTE